MARLQGATCPYCRGPLSPGLFKLQGRGEPGGPVHGGQGYLWSCQRCRQHLCGYCLQRLEVTVAPLPQEKKGERPAKIVTTVRDEAGQVVETRESLSREPHCARCQADLSEPFSQATARWHHRWGLNQTLHTVGALGMGLGFAYLIFVSPALGVEKGSPRAMVEGSIFALFLALWLSTLVGNYAFARKANTYIQKVVAPGNRIEQRATYDLDTRRLEYLDPPVTIEHKVDYTVQ